MSRMNPDKEEMLSIASVVTRAVDTPGRRVSLHGACLGGFIGVLTVCRLNGLNAERLFKEAEKACPPVS